MPVASRTWADRLSELGRFAAFAGRVLRGTVGLRWSYREALGHGATVGRRCFLPVSATIFPFGAVIGVQGMRIFDMFSAHQLLSGLLALVIIRELAPVLAAVLVAAQAGSSYAAELGAMRIKEELDTTEVMAVDPVLWHVVPRVVAIAGVVPVLTIIANAFGLLGGYVVAVGIYGQASGVYLSHLPELIGPTDLLASGVKGLVFGVLVGLIATWKGFSTSGGAEGVGRAVNDTVVLSVVLILVFNYALSSMLFGGSLTP